MAEKVYTPVHKSIKVANNIVIGGMIAFGKSTLAETLHKRIEPSKLVFELDDKDELMMLLLDKMYQRSNNVLFGSLFQLYFVLNRFENYKKNCNSSDLTIFDRSIFEDWLFARENINKPSVFNYYDSLWQNICQELIYEFGVPKLYIILDGDWELFKERIFLRNRKVEIDNFTKNEDYFRHLLSIYKEYLIGTCKDFGIKYLVVDARLELEEKVRLVEEALKEM
ncbi:deoxynucleoside kinase [Ureaplasma ceti]|uniref:Deoxynucleoside kinase n=1 Tax=Ureaplasma ceti TaxID=3119530 RepID=A0ABP9U9S3_9BACT